MSQIVANSVLDRNLGALLTLNPALARELAETEPPTADSLCWLTTEETDARTGESILSATYQDSPSGPARALASRRGPIAEAERWAAQANLHAHAAFVVRGMGLGYHAQALVRRINGRGTVIVFEPDKRLLRGVLERIDHSSWLGSVALLTDPDDRGAMVEATGRIEPLIAMGTSVLDHPASLARIGAGGPRFMERFTGVIAAVRVNLASTLLQTKVTLRNCLQNLDHYVVRPGIEPLRGAFNGRPAIVVSAGPSLNRNVDLLSRPGVADRFVIIAVQTVLRPLLDRGIKPHFVCALDYHEVSRRFYEGLTSESVEGITLVVEPKVNPSVPAAFPGTVRLAAEGFLDALLEDGVAGRGLSRPMGVLPAGTTVAHLCYYLARFFGCDPVCLIGQDLGFTDGQYYSAGAAIHATWGGELNSYKSLELLEWQRIVRHRGMLRRETDHLGRAVYTDEQMHVYLSQFARDFRADTLAGRVVIDATEGGVRKPHTICRALSEVIDEELARPAPASTVAQLIAAVSCAEPAIDARDRLARVADRLRAVRQQCWRIAELSRRAGLHLSEATEHHQDQARVNALIGKLESLKEQVAQQDTGWRFVRLLNQAGSFKRLKADRAIALSSDIDDMTRQRRQLERDAMNVSWIAESADDMGELLDGAVETLRSGVRTTREPAPDLDDAPALRTTGAVLAAVIPLDTRRTWWGAERSPLDAVIGGRTSFSLTLERVARAASVGPIIVATDNPELAARAAAGAPDTALMRVVYHRTDTPNPWPERVARAARAHAAANWRGGHNDFTAFDEAMNTERVGQLLERFGGEIGAAVAIGPGWWGVDPELIDAAAGRYRENPRLNRLSFAHAAPGFGTAILDRGLLTELGNARRNGGLWGSLGGLLGYAPVAPSADLIGKAQCVSTDPLLRHTLLRATADTPFEAGLAEKAMADAGLDVRSATAAQIATALNSHARTGLLGPLHIMITLDASYPGLDEAVARLGALRSAAAGATVTIHCASLVHADLEALAQHVRRVHPFASLHVRTDLRGDSDQVCRVLTLDPDVVSVDCYGDSPQTYSLITGKDAATFSRLRRNLEALMDSRASIADVDSGQILRLPLVVPRMTRQDAVYGEIEDWYDRHLLACGWAAIDSLVRPIPGQRIAPLPLPALAAERIDRSTLHIGRDR